MEHPQLDGLKLTARCCACGVVVLTGRDIALTHHDEFTGGTCWIRCTCGAQRLLPVDAESARLLQEAGVGPVLPSPSTAITRRELKKFKRRLRQTDFISALAWRSIGTVSPHHP